ncbi:hypothetical protein [Aestuariivirga sp.]|uniref:hypothetical protein n=1 Tax=Aestuariivirga sp. TaxID=2650926 RepID=UPI0025BA2F03|nr:hypothetical protein [Aestuariivirga sp.]MCA3554187.1 hypothetical protein [Aestuariivirga sp.]
MFHPLISAVPSRLIAAAAAVSLLAATAPDARADKKISNTGAAIVGGIAGLAIGAAIADSANRNRRDYQPRYQPYPPPPPYAYAQPYPVYYPQPVYRPAYARPFSPVASVVCYPDRGLCFNESNGSIANKWTARVFGN